MVGGWEYKGIGKGGRLGQIGPVVAAAIWRGPVAPVRGGWTRALDGTYGQWLHVDWEYSGSGEPTAAICLRGSNFVDTGKVQHPIVGGPCAGSAID